jgi:hypothetical protein
MRTSPPKKPYNPPIIQFDFTVADLEKMNNEDPKITQKFNGDDKSQSTYEQSTLASLDDISYLQLNLETGAQKSSKKPPPTFQQIEARFDTTYAEALFSYQKAKQEIKKPDPIGTVRPLRPFELDYFNYMSDHYQNLPTIRKKNHFFNNPPQTWIKRYEAFNIPTTFYSDIDLLYDFAANHCPLAERNNWRKVLAPVSSSTELKVERFIWALLFLKSTNGVADKVSCGHFSKVVKDHPPITLQIYKDPLLIASILRQTSKWVKNTVSQRLIILYI